MAPATPGLAPSAQASGTTLAALAEPEYGSFLVRK